MAIRPELYDYLKTLDIQAYRKGAVFAINAPTWEIKPTVTLDDFVGDFETDEIGALRDFAAVPTHSSTPFFPDSSVLDRKCGPEELPNIIMPQLAIPDYFKPNLLFKYFIGGDLSVNGDKTGVSMVHYDYGIDKVVLDFSLQIRAPRGSRVDYAPIRALFRRLRERGFNIGAIAFDQFQSNDSINILIKDGFNAKQVQYSETFVGNTQLQELILFDKFVYNRRDDVFIGEAKELQVVNSKRVDHLMSEGYYNSKDVFDSVVNATILCLDDYYKRGNPIEKAKTLESVQNKILEQKPIDDAGDISWLL